MKSLQGKRVLEGVVTSDKMKKTIVVTVVKKLAHPVYNRLVTKRKKFKVHDEKSQAKAGDRVTIVECSPISREKHFRLLEVLK